MLRSLSFLLFIPILTLLALNSCGKVFDEHSQDEVHDFHKLQIDSALSLIDSLVYSNKIKIHVKIDTEFVEKAKKGSLSSELLLQIAAAKLLEKDTTKAKTFFINSLNTSQTQADSLSAILPLVKLYKIEGNIDSVMYFVNVLSNTGMKPANSGINFEIYKYLLDHHISNEDYDLAIIHCDKFIDYMDNILIADYKNQIYSLQQDNKRLVNENGFFESFLFFSLILTLILIIIFITTIVWLRKKMCRLKTLNNRLIYDNEKSFSRNKLLNQMVMQFCSSERELDTILRRFVKEKSKLCELIRSEQFNHRKIVNDIIAKISENYYKSDYVDESHRPFLNSGDYSLLFLLEFNYSIKEISSILGISTQAFHMRRKRVEEKLKNLEYSDSKIEKILKKSVS